MTKIILRKSKNQYYSHRAAILGQTPGTAVDWFYSIEGNVNNTYRAASFIVELPGPLLGKYQFLLPPSEVNLLVDYNTVQS